MLSAAIGCAKPSDSSHYGYLSEHHSFGQPDQVSGDYAEDLAAVMLATTLGISDFDIEHDWDARKNAFTISGKIVETKGINATAVVNKYDEWTCVVASAVFVD
jgi:arginine decarboxylase